MSELRNYDSPWYDKAVNYLTDTFYGPNANAQDRAWVNKLAGPENPFNFPAQATQGIEQAYSGYNRGDYGQMALGIGQTGLALSPALGARAMMPSVRQSMIARNKHGMFPNEQSAFAGRPSPGLDDFMIMHGPPPSRPPTNMVTVPRSDAFTANSNIIPRGEMVRYGDDITTQQRYGTDREKVIRSLDYLRRKMNESAAIHGRPNQVDLDQSNHLQQYLDEMRPNLTVVPSQ
jgi:hypothetical protein